MKLKHRLALYSVLIFSVVILIASAAIYISFYKKMEAIELQVLKNKTLLAAVYYLEDDEVGNEERETIQNQLRRSISRKNIAVYNSKNVIAKGEMGVDNFITKDFLNQVRNQREAHLVLDNNFYFGLYYEDNEGDFVVITREDKSEFNQQLLALLQILIVVFIVGVILIFIVSQFLGRLAYAPIIKIIDQIKERDNNNFHQPIRSGENDYAEIKDLIVSYNHFIEKLSNTFHIQKNFIDYVSHELRTPITAILGNLEVTNTKDRSIVEYKENIQLIKQYILDLEETLEKMTLLSGANTRLEFNEIRIDEVVWHVIEHAILYHNANIDVNIEVEDTADFYIQGNAKMLELALSNIVENAIKYSRNSIIKLHVYKENSKIRIDVIDTGIGIPAKDLVNIKQNFYRAENTKEFQGKGIGLSLANIIFDLHKINLDIKSDSKGTCVSLIFNK